MIQFDDSTSHLVEAAYTTPDVVEQRRMVLVSLALRPGDVVLDIGSGPGFLAHGMAAVVGPEGSVRAIDSSASMLALARSRSPAEGSSPVEFSAGDATALPFADNIFDAVTSTQVYEYLGNVPLALAEAYRVLRRGGRLLVLDTDWDTIAWACGDDERMRRVLAAWDGHLADAHLPRRLPQLLRAAGFEVTRGSALPMLNIGYQPGIFSAHLIGMIEAYVPTRAGLTTADARAWADDLRAMGADYFFSLNRYLFMAVK